MRKVSLPKIDIGLLLLITGSFSNLPLWIGVFVATEAEGPVSAWIEGVLLPVVGGLAGLFMAVTVAVGLVYVLGRLGRLQPTLERKQRGKDEYRTVPNPRYYTAAGSVVALIVISLVLLSPYVYLMGQGGEHLFTVLGEFAGAWSVGRVLAADLALTAVAAVHGAVSLGSAERGSEQKPAAEQTAEQKPAKAKARSAKASRPVSEFTCRYTGCNHTEPTQGAINAHGGRCKFNPKNAIQVGGTVFEGKSGER